jgi:uncharacterized sulfatase
MKSKDPDVLIEGKQKRFEGEYTPDVLTNLAMDYIRKYKDEPFALSLHYWAPHANTEFPEGFNPPYNDRSWLPLKEEDLEHWKDTKLILPDPDFPNLDTARVKRMMREYYASVHSVDRNVGRLLNLLDQLDLDRNTIVIFTSDHGYMMGQHGLWHKGNGRWLTRDQSDPAGQYIGDRSNLFDLSLRVPCIVRWTDHIQPSGTIDKAISFIDWFPTIIDLTGVEPDGEFELRGNSFAPLLLGEDIDWNDDLYFEYKSLRAYRTPDWKFVRHFEDTTLDELYHLTEDPDEIKNLIKSKDPNVVRKYRELKKLLNIKMENLQDPILDQSKMHHVNPGT